ncbi:TonB-dependent receptor protein [Neokomagataea thailandica NBRC 106555]|uniref:TonB-dependent receptor n=2 Tax=Neokomagataea TaxID=1223423 RepID=A0A4Y6V8U6_9PROT|nr:MULTISPECIES: TonB-dependent receptor [Neokomagataea]QDH25774.1 TonB-dependent receptor [Neokomagataea tanensis]GBR52982.1 TonB-dependent receptor protein [Neokomagataea thailandica NBRC 106555]
MSSSVTRQLLCASILASSALTVVPVYAASSHDVARHHHAKAKAAATSARTAPVATPVAAPVSVQPAPVAVSRRRPGAMRPAMIEASGADERVVVTGSALVSSRNSSANPVQIVSSKQIQQTGATTLNDFFSRLPSMGSSGTTNTATNGGGGVTCADLRNLGTKRVLVLIDGKRASMNGRNNCIDLNAIPIQQISSVEILKDGGSELYGADAVSGVINIKLRHDLNDANITVRGGITGQGDNQTGMISGYKGWNFDHGKGNLTLFGSYMTQGGVMQRDRSWASPVQLTNNPGGAAANTFGSGFSDIARVTGSGVNVGVAPDGTVLGRWNNSYRYNFGPRASLTNQLQSSNLSGDTHYEINHHFNVYSNVLYSHRTSSTFMAPNPFNGSIQPSTLPSVLSVPANDPRNTFGTNVGVIKRFTEFGDRRTEVASDTVTAKFGVNGDVAYGWKYDASYTYGANRTNTKTLNIGSYTNLLNAYGLRQVTPGSSASALAYDPSVCPSFGCSSPFKALSPEAVSYVNRNVSSDAAYFLRDWNLRFHNNSVVHMPWAHGGALGIAMGMERRGEQLSNKPDPLVQSGESMTNTVLPTSGGFHVTEGYLEGQLTLLHNAFLAKDLTIDGQGRISAYNTFGAAKIWKGSISWAPVSDIRFRGTLGTSFRQPNVNELYGGRSISYNTASDPCDMNRVNSYGAASAIVAANCARQGIDTKTFTQSGSAQVPTIGGGNTQLQPEEGRTYTFGTVITPRWIPGLSLSGEYWHYSISHMISALPTTYILNNCYDGSNTSLCSQVNRLSNGQISTVSAYAQNIGALRTSGVDFDFDYRHHITSNDIVSVSNNFQYLLNYKQQFVPGGAFSDYTGALLYNNGSGNPRVRDYTTLGWTHGAVSINYMLQFTGGMRWNDTSKWEPTTSGRYKTPMMIQQDLSASYRLNRWNFTGGIQNITNKKPPFVTSGSDNSVGAVYGGFYPGRYIFLQAGISL